MPNDKLVRTHSFPDYKFIYGNYEITGYADGDDVIKFESDEVSFKKKTGAGGARSRALIARGDSGKFSLKILKSDPDNSYLSKELINHTRGGGIPKPASLVDGRGTTIISTKQAWPMRWPQNDTGEDVTVLEWEIDCGECDINYGHNNP